MTQTKRRLYLIRELLCEQSQYAGMQIPEDETGQKRLLRSLFNIRMPHPASEEFSADTGCLSAGGDPAQRDHPPG